MSNPDDVLIMLVKALCTPLGYRQGSNSNWRITLVHNGGGFLINDAGYPQEEDIIIKAPLATAIVLKRAREYGVRLQWKRVARYNPMELEWGFHLQHGCPTIEKHIRRYCNGMSVTTLVEDMGW